MAQQNPFAPGTKFVDLAALSLSGSLVPSVPTEIRLKYNPPKMYVVYHFEKRPNEEYFHVIAIDPNMLATMDAEEIVSHLYVTEAYYFNPKQVRRSQLVGLINRL